MLSVYDYVVIAAYFAFMVALGACFRKANRDTSDYFRSGGQLLWWMVGATAFMTHFSAWTFTGAASKAYESGAVILVIYFANAAGFFLNYLTTAPRMRRMRVITTLEGIRQRWNVRNEQFFAWILLPTGLLLGGIGLNGLGLILSAIFGLNIDLTIIVAGGIVVAMTTLGGNWAATATDFIQLIILVLLTVVTAILSLQHIGGLSGFIDALPSGSLRWGELPHDRIFVIWLLAILLKQLFGTNNMSEAYRYLSARDDGQARRGALLAAILFIVGPVVWFLPPMVARMLYPDLSLLPEYAALGARASEAAYLAISTKVMPDGMVGLMITALFAATMSSMDSGLNKNVGIFIRSFWAVFIRKNASEHELLLTSRLATVGFGILIVASALFFNAMVDLSLFDLMMQFGALVSTPIAIPLLGGLFIKKTPPWSAWSTVIVALVASLCAGNLARWWGDDIYQQLFGLSRPLAAGERVDAVFAVTILGSLFCGAGWFLGSTWWYRRQTVEFQHRTEHFFQKLRSPVEPEPSAGTASDGAQHTIMGWACLLYGAFLALLALIPNPVTGRLWFLALALVTAAIGVALRRSGRAKRDPRPASTLRA